MTIWTPNIEGDVGPRYVAIANAIASDLQRGVLTPGARLPTHRDLARQLGVTVGTVTRGYAEAERRGLTSGEVGRGTFIREAEASDHGWALPAAVEPREIEMSLSLPAALSGQEDVHLLAETLREIAGDPNLGKVLRYHPESGTLRQRAAGASWLRKTGLTAEPEEVLITAGVQHGLTATFAALFRPGDLVLTASLTYPAIKGLAQLQGLRIRGVNLDEEGVIPEELERACESEVRPVALYLVPTIQNPTGGVMSLERREAIAEIARRHDILIIEDDIHAFLLELPPTPIAVYAPERTIYLSSLSKALTHGLRTGFVLAPQELRDRILAGIRTTIWMAPPLMSEIAARWIEDGTAETILDLKRAEVAARQKIVRDALHAYRLDLHPQAFHGWLHLPDPWRSDEVVAQARQRDVLVAGAEAFAVGRRGVPHAVRISFGAVPRADLARGLETLDDILQGCCDPCVNVL